MNLFSSENARLYSKIINKIIINLIIAVPVYGDSFSLLIFSVVYILKNAIIIPTFTAKGDDI